MLSLTFLVSTGGHCFGKAALAWTWCSIRVQHSHLHRQLCICIRYMDTAGDAEGSVTPTAARPASQPQLQPVSAHQMNPVTPHGCVLPHHLSCSGMAPGEFAFLLNNGPETDTAIYDGTNNGVGLTEATAQIMRFDASPLPVGQVARPFTLARQKVLNKALIADYAATVKPIVPRATARQVGVYVWDRDVVDGVVRCLGACRFCSELSCSTSKGNYTHVPTMHMQHQANNPPPLSSFCWY